MTVDDFLAWAVKQPARYELELGTIDAMSPESLGYVRIKTMIQRALAVAIQHANLCCKAVHDGVIVRVDGATAYEPDALVYCGPHQPASTLVVDDAVIVVEVVLPHSEVGSRGGRLIAYLSLPSVHHYLIVNANRRVLVHHARRGEKIATRILHDGPLHLDPPGLDLTIEDLFGESDAP